MVNSKRVRLITAKEYEQGAIIYQMCRELRAEDNDALLFAQQLAMSKGEKLIVNYVIYNYRWVGATARFYDWVITSLKEVEEALRQRNIPLVITFEHKNLFKKYQAQPIPDHIGAVIVEQIPLHFAKKWKELFKINHASIPLYEVDAHNCIPVWELSSKQEFAARTIRSKVHAMLPRFLEEYDDLTVHLHNKMLQVSLGWFLGSMGRIKYCLIS
jgi:deoxyribodipyrimidine photo-lyase